MSSSSSSSSSSSISSSSSSCAQSVFPLVTLKRSLDPRNIVGGWYTGDQARAVQAKLTPSDAHHDADAFLLLARDGTRHNLLAEKCKNQLVKTSVMDW